MIILDENDNDPVFIEPEISITVGEGEEVGEVLVQGQLASDNDAGANGQISYSLLSDEGEELSKHRIKVYCTGHSLVTTRAVQGVTL